MNLNGALKLPSPSMEAAAFTHQFGPSNVGIADTISENGPSKFEESTALTTKWYSTPFCRFVTRCIVSAVLVALVSSFLSVVLLKE